MNPSVADKALELHKTHRGKLCTCSKVNLTEHTLSLLYTPGVGAVSKAIADDPSVADELTWRSNAVAIVSDGSAVLGLGNVGPDAALAVMEGKAVLFKELVGIDAVPIVVNTGSSQELCKLLFQLAPSFGGVNLEDIAAPRCFELTHMLKTRGYPRPYMHDDQHGTAVVVAAALMNALKVVGKKLEDCKVVLYGAGAAGLTVARMLLGMEFPRKFGRVAELYVVDEYGLLYNGRKHLNEWHRTIVSKLSGSHLTSPREAFEGADIFIGLSAPNVVGEREIASMSPHAIVFALANPVPEILPEQAKRAGAEVIATGRSDYPNQVNNALAFPGIFRGALDSNAEEITREMMFAAAQAIANHVEEPTPENIMPSLLDRHLHSAVARAVAKAMG
jgi:malate dehydrogenase (oxaloacetate-decarboxylating)